MQNQDLGVIRSSFADEPEMADLIALFVDDVPEKIARLQQAIEAEDIQAVRTFAHQLKGAAGGYGFETLTPVALELEQTAAAASNISDTMPQANVLISHLRALSV